MAGPNSRPAPSVVVLGWGCLGLVAGLIFVLTGYTSASRGLLLLGAGLVVVAAVPVVIGSAAIGTRMALREHADDQQRPS